MWFRQDTPEHQSSHVCTRSGEAALGTSYISGKDTGFLPVSPGPEARNHQPMLPKAKDRAEVASTSKGVKIALTKGLIRAAQSLTRVGSGLLIVTEILVTRPLCTPNRGPAQARSALAVVGGRDS